MTPPYLPILTSVIVVFNFHAEPIKALRNGILVLKRLPIVVFLLNLLLLDLGQFRLVLPVSLHIGSDLLDELLALLLSWCDHLVGQSSMPRRELPVLQPVVLVGKVRVQVVDVHLGDARPRFFLLCTAHDFHVCTQSATNSDAFSHLLLLVPVLKDLWVVISDLGWGKRAQLRWLTPFSLRAIATNLERLNLNGFLPVLMESLRVEEFFAV